MDKENHKERKIKEFDKLSDKEKTILAKQLINKTKKILSQTNNFSLTKSYRHDFIVDGLEYRAGYNRQKNFTGIYLEQVILRDSKFPVQAKKAEGFGIKIDRCSDKEGSSKDLPYARFVFQDKNQTMFYDSQETIDKINSFLENFARKAN